MRRSVFKTDPLSLMERAYDYRQWGLLKEAQRLMNRACLSVIEEETDVSKLEGTETPKEARHAWWNWG